MLRAHRVDDVRRAEALAMAGLPDDALMQRAAAGKIGTYGLGWTVREAGGALALWDALVATLDASVTADTREDRMRFEALEYAEHSAATPRV